MFDLKKTIDLIKGGLLEPKATWQSYLAENRGWQDTATILTLPLIVASFIIAGILTLLFSGFYMVPRGGVGAWLLGLIMAVISIAAAAFIFSYLAGVFKGRHDFNKGLAAISLAAVPAYVGNALSALPLVGWLISLALGIVTLVFLYQIIPSYLEVPDDKRVLHYVVSLVATFVVMLVLGLVLGAGGMSQMPQGASMSSNQPGQPGMFGDLQRYAQMMEQAQQDRYEPPEDGKITEAQMADLMDVLRRSADIRKEQLARMEQLKEKYDGKEPDATDLPAMTGTVSSVLGAFNAEMEVVMTGKGNWAEHQWIKEQLRVARVQRDASEAISHNYQMYQAHRDELRELDATL